jgi:hypothetical protein
LECSVAVKDGSRVVAGIPRFGLTFRFSLFSVSSFFFSCSPLVRGLSLAFYKARECGVTADLVMPCRRDNSRDMCPITEII